MEGEWLVGLPHTTHTHTLMGGYTDGWTDDKMSGWMVGAHTTRTHTHTHKYINKDVRYGSSWSGVGAVCGR
jgi:hypothetical protein